MCAPKAPAPPDPKETSAAQTGTSVSTAITNAMLGNVNQVTPDGTLTYDQTGSFEHTDPYTGSSYDIPTFTATQTLSETQQKLKDENDATSQNLAETANQQSGFFKDYLGQPIDLNNEEVESRLYDLGSKRLDPRFERERDAMETRLSNQGIVKGSEAYDREMERLDQGKNDAYNQLILGGRGQAVQEAMAERNQPINEISALMSGSQVSQPNFIPTDMPTVPTTDNAGLINKNYDQRLNAWQQNSASSGGLFGSILGGVGKLAGGWLASDERVKKDVEKVGQLDGHNLYRYHYKDEPDSAPKHIGVLAQEAEKTRPDAVAEFDDGVKRVHYGSLFGMGA